MNKDEKRVLRRKRFTIASHLTLTEALLEDMTSLPLLTPQGRDQVKAEHGNNARVERWLELLPHLDRKQTYSALCDFLDSHHPWLADDLRVELKAEKAGAGFKLEEPIRKEAEALVQRDFGNSRRLSEFDKRDIRNLVGCRMQCMKDVWRKQRDKIQNNLEDELKLKQNYKDKSLDLVSMIAGFLRINRGHLRASIATKDCSNMSKSAKNPGQVLTEQATDRAVAAELCSSVRELVDVSSQCFLELEQHQEEKRKSLQILSLEDETLKLDTELEDVMEKLELNAAALEDKIRQKDIKIQSLQDEITRKENQALEDGQRHNKEIKNLKRHLNTAHEKIRDLESTIEGLQRDLNETKEDLGRTKNKSDLLEKSRRLGFISDTSKPGSDRGDSGGGNKIGRRPVTRPVAGGNKKPVKKNY